MADLARQAARQLLDESLTMLLPSMRRRLELLDASGGLKQSESKGSRSDRLTVPLARLDALAAAGVISGEDVERWRSRYERALELSERPLPDPPPELSELARLYVAERERDARAEIERASPEELEGPSRSRARTLQTRAAQARYCLAELGLLPDGEAYPEPQRRPAPRRTELLAVAVAPGLNPPETGRTPADALADGSSQRGVRLTCAELYADAVVVRWHLLLPRAPSETERQARNQDLGWLLDQGQRHAPALELTDDTRTRYAPLPRPRIGGPQGPTPVPGPLVIWGATTFTPAVPEASQTLTVTINDRQITIPLGRG